VILPESVDYWTDRLADAGVDVAEELGSRLVLPDWLESERESATKGITSHSPRIVRTNIAGRDSKLSPVTHRTPLSGRATP